MNAQKKILSLFLTAAMLLSLAAGMMIPAQAAEGEAEAAQPASWNSTYVGVMAVEGQEYTIAPKGSAPDWSKAVEPKDGLVSFEDLTPATAYTIFTRLKGETGEPRTTDITTPLTGIGFSSEADALVVGATLTVTPDPEDAQGLTYQWYYDAVTPEGDGERHEYTPIDGATGAAYTVQAADVGKELAVKAFVGEEEVAELSISGGPVVEGDAPESGVQEPELAMWSPEDIQVRGVEGQEYVISVKGSEPDWSKAVEPKDGFVIFENLTPATAYVISTRLKGGEGEPKFIELTTALIGIGVISENDYVVGAVLRVEPDPEDTQGLTYQWYHDTITPEEDGERHEYTPIDGAAAETYTIQAADQGKYLAVKAFRDGVEVGDIGSLGPVGGEDGPATSDDASACPKDSTCPISQFTDAKPDAWYHDGVHYVLENGIMNGVGDGKFAPSAATTRGMIVTMLWRMEGEPSADSAGFNDVQAGSWYEDAVNWAAANKIVSGYGDGKFGPMDNVTREQLVAILYRYAQFKGMDVSVGEDTNILSYDDVQALSDWAFPAMQWGAGAGVINGKTESTLAPKAEATRAEVATMLQRFSEGLGDADQQDGLYLILVNKTNKLPDNWEEKIELMDMKNAYDEDIRVEKGSYEAFVALREALLEDGVDIELDSCYRSVERQQELWDEFEKEYGLDYCEQYVAAPGCSEHHTGFAVDVCLIKDGELIYENDAMMKETDIWAKVHEKMPEFGFILRYPEGKEDITGYSYEPWHMRYVGDADIAGEITQKGITLEEYLGQTEQGS